MMKCALLGLTGVLALSLTAHAQEDETFTPEELRITAAEDAGPALSLYRPDLFSTVDGSVLIHGLPVLTLMDGRRFPVSSELGRMGMARLDFVPLAFLSAVEVRKDGASQVYGSDAPGGVIDLRLKRISTGGEVGFFYGRSDGKYDREDFQAYIIGGVGNEKFQITAGAAYEESSGHFRRSSR